MRPRVLFALSVPSFVAAVFLIFPASAFAQQVGIKAGVTFASLTPEEDEDPDLSRRRGLVAGGWFRMPPTSSLLVPSRRSVLRKGREIRERSIRRGQRGDRSTSAFVTSRSRCWRASTRQPRARRRASSSLAAPRRRSGYRLAPRLRSRENKKPEISATTSNRSISGWPADLASSSGAC